MKKIYTSSYKRLNFLIKNGEIIKEKGGKFFLKNGIRIFPLIVSYTIPKYFRHQIPKIEELKPTYELLMKYKNKQIGENEYSKGYKELVKGRITSKELYNSLKNNSVLLCWEEKGFCHRYLIVELLNEYKEIKHKEL